MRRTITIILSIPLLLIGGEAVSLLFLVLLVGGIPAIGIGVGPLVSYWLATVLAIVSAVLVFMLRDTLLERLGEPPSEA